MCLVAATAAFGLVGVPFAAPAGAAAGDITTIAGNGSTSTGYVGDGGPATAALFGANGMAIDADGNVLTADEGNHRVRVVAASAENPGYPLAGCAQTCVWTVGDMYTIAGTGALPPASSGVPATSAAVDPEAIAIDAAGNPVVAGGSGHVVQVVAVSASNPGYTLGGCTGPCTWTVGDIFTIAGDGSNGALTGGVPATTAPVAIPWGIAVDADGNVLFDDIADAVVRVVAVSGANPGYPLGGCAGPCTWAVGDIFTIAGTGTADYSGDGGQATSAEFSGPVGLAIDAQSNVLVSDIGTNRVRVVAVSATNPGYPLAGCVSTCTWVAGDVYTIAGYGGDSYSGDGGPAEFAGLNQPAGLTVDAQGNVLVADLDNAVVRLVAVAAHNAGYVLGGCAASCSWQPGQIYTIAGNGTHGYSGDGGPALDAELRFPISVALTADGDVLVGAANQIRRVGVRNDAATVRVNFGGFGATGASYTVVVTGSGPAPTGTVTIDDDNGGSCTVSPSSSGASCLITESPAGGPYTVTAHYGGDGYYKPATSAPILVDAAVASGADGEASAIVDGFTVDATGGTAGTTVLGIAQYEPDPAATPNVVSTGKYFIVTTTSWFQQVDITDCGLNGGNDLSWLSGPSFSSGWSPARGNPGPTYVDGPTPCVDVSLDGTAAPAPSILSGRIWTARKTPPGVPTGVVAQPGNGSAVVQWTAPTANGAAPPTGYVVTPYSGPSRLRSRVFNSPATSAVVDGLPNGKVRSFRVAAINAAGSGSESVVSRDIVVGGLTAPKNVRAVSGAATAKTGSLRVHYEFVPDEDVAATHFVATCTSHSDVPARSATRRSSTAGDIVVTKLRTRHAYKCRVRAVNGIGVELTSDPSPSVTVGTPVPPSHVQIVRDAAGHPEITFTHGSANGARVIEYVAHCYSLDGGDRTNSSSGSPIRISLMVHHTYSCWVVAVNGRGTSPASLPSDRFRA